MTRISIVIAWVLVGFTGHVHAAEPALKYKKEVAAASKADETLVAVPLDAQVFAATQPDFADVRLLDSQEKALPFIVRKSQKLQTRSVRRRTWTAQKPSLRPLESGGLEITLTLDKDDPPPSGLSLISPLRNFEQRVRILTSSDGDAWEPIGRETVIFDYSRYMDVRNDSVPFPASTHKQIRIVIDDVTLEQQSELLELTRRLRGDDETDRTEKVTIDRRPFRIERIDFWQDGSEEKVLGNHAMDYPVAGFKVTQDEKSRQTFIAIETQREPLTSLELVTTSRNFSRGCTVEVQEQLGVQSTWKQIESTTLSRIDFKSLKREQLKIDFPETRSAQYRLVIDNRDSPPLDVTEIKAVGNVYEVVFLSATNKPHSLHYGDAKALAPSYDTVALQALLSERYRPEIVALGTEQKTDAIPSANTLVSLVNDPRLLTVIISLLVVALGWGLYAAVKRIDATSPPPSDPPPPSSPA